MAVKDEMIKCVCVCWGVGELLKRQGKGLERVVFLEFREEGDLRKGWRGGREGRRMGVGLQVFEYVEERENREKSVVYGQKEDQWVYILIMCI